MKQVLVLAFCDLHRARGEQVESDGEYTIRINSTERLLDLCGECRLSLVDPVMEAMKLGSKVDAATPPAARPKAENPPSPNRNTKSGRKVTLRPLEPGEGWTGTDPVAELRCPICHAKYGSRSSLQGHVVGIHAMKLREAEREMGLPISGITKDYERDCPECGQKCHSPQGWGAHRRSAHGVTGTNNPNSRQGSVMAA